MAEAIEMFRDLNLRGPVARRPALREALIGAAVDPWRFDQQWSDEVARNAVTSEDVLLFRRAPGDDYPGAGLTLWGREDGYYVPNIVPLESGNLTYAQYNAILSDFIARIVEPIAPALGFAIDASASHQTLDDWVSADTAIRLRRFSGAANKSTGASHPMDQQRWFDFIIAVHRNKDQLGTDQLARWLNEAEHWHEDTAHDLAGNFETALALLARYDET